MSFSVDALAAESDVLADLGLSASTRRLERIANAVTSRIQRFLGFSLGRKTYSTVTPEQYQGSGGPFLLLSRRPIEAIEAVYIDDALDDEWDQSEELDAKGQLYRANGWPKRTERDSLLGLPSQWAAFNVKVAWTGGYWLPNAAGTMPGTAKTLPDEFQEVAISEICYSYRNPSRNITSETTAGGWTRKYAEPNKVEDSAWGLLKVNVSTLTGLKKRYFGHA